MPLLSESGDNMDCVIGAGFNLNGYRARRIAGKVKYVHRLEWERLRGPIPKGLWIDHTCRNRACANVEHLRLVTPRINAIENSTGITARNAVKTHCVAGHSFAEFGSVSKGAKTRGERVCRECKRLRNAVERADPEKRQQYLKRAKGYDAARAKDRWLKIKKSPKALRAHRVQAREAMRLTRNRQAVGIGG